MASAKSPKDTAEIRFLKINLKREELSLIALFLGVAAVIAAAAIFMPDAFRDAKPPAAVAVSTSSAAAPITASVDPIVDRGVYALGKVQMTIGVDNNYVDSDIDLEYDRDVLRSVTPTEEKDNSAANQFFRDSRDKIRDAIITEASGFSGTRLTGEGLDELKIRLLGAINDAFTTDGDLVTNIYFQAFLRLPPEQ